MVGGQAAADAFLRTYFVPGMHHCSGGPGVDRFDMLTVLEQWVERGVAPGRVVAARVVDGTTVRSRPLCPHPQVAAYSGTGCDRRRRELRLPRLSVIRLTEWRPSPPAVSETWWERR